MLHNGADDDNFLECTGTEITFENLTMLQLGGYDGIVQVWGSFEGTRASLLLVCTETSFESASVSFLTLDPKSFSYIPLLSIPRCLQVGPPSLTAPCSVGTMAVLPC